MLKSKEGDRLFRRVVVKIIYPKDVLPPQTYVQRAGPRQGFTSDSIDEILMNHADRLEQLYPFWEFKMIPLAPSGREAKYVFNFAGYRSMVPKIDIAEVTSEPTTIEEEQHSGSETTASSQGDGTIA